MPSSSSQTKETSLRLSNESFSFSWLADVDKPSLELAPYVVSTHRSSTSDAYDFDFGLSRRLSPVLVHADQIFSNGFLLPLHAAVDQSKSDSSTTMTTTSESSSDSRSLSRSLSLDSSDSYISFSNRYHRPQYCCDATSRRLASLEGSPLFPASASASSGRSKTKLPFLKSCARKYLCLSFLFPWTKKARRTLRFLRSKTQVTSAPLTAAGDDVFSSAQRRRGQRISDSIYESAIDEAILHCKKSVVST